MKCPKCPKCGKEVIYFGEDDAYICEKSKGGCGCVTSGTYLISKEIREGFNFLGLVLYRMEPDEHRGKNSLYWEKIQSELKKRGIKL